jgi:hypothetical protein
MDALLPLIILALVIFGAWKVLSGKKSPLSKTSSSRSSSESNREATSQEFHWEGKGDFDFEVVGESNYQVALASLAGDHGAESAEAHHRATLTLEDANPYDPKAVAVRIAGKTVGYLAREDARSYRRRLGQKRLSGVNATCDAIVVGGGTRRNGEKLFYGVKLDIKPFE